MQINPLCRPLIYNKNKIKEKTKISKSIDIVAHQIEIKYRI
jgi:hypothetical protein